MNRRNFLTLGLKAAVLAVAITMPIARVAVAGSPRDLRPHEWVAMKRTEWENTKVLRRVSKPDYISRS